MADNKPINNRQNHSLGIEKTRILSDNYNAYIVSYQGAKEHISFNLSDNGLKEISWDSRDEIEVFKPCTRLEEIAIVHLKGFDIDLRWAKNSSDLMKIFLDQHVAYYGGMNLKKSALSDTKNRLNKLFIQHRTPIEERGDITKQNKIVAGSHSYFSKHGSDNKNYMPSDYLTPKFDLIINVQHHNGRVETIKFKSVSFYKLSQKTSENGAEIEESIKAFSPSCELVSAGKNQQANSPKAEVFIHDALVRMMTPPAENKENLSYYERKIINSDNLKIYKNSGKHQF
jgi:hypothetical protein